MAEKTDTWPEERSGADINARNNMTCAAGVRQILTARACRLEVDTLQEKLQACGLLQASSQGTDNANAM